MIISKITDSVLSTEIQDNQSDQFPDFDDVGLAIRLRQTLSTIRSWRSRQPDRLPPGARVGRVWLYDKNVVEKWLAEKRGATPIPVEKKQSSICYSGRKRRGKPSKVESAAANALGVTVPVWRELQEFDSSPRSRNLTTARGGDK